MNKKIKMINTYYFNDDILINIFSYLFYYPIHISDTIWNKNGIIEVIYNKTFMNLYKNKIKKYLYFKLISKKTYSNKINYIIYFLHLYNQIYEKKNQQNYIKYIYFNYILNFDFEFISITKTNKLIRDLYLYKTYDDFNEQKLIKYINKCEIFTLQINYMKKIKFWKLYFKNYLIYINNDLSLFKVFSLLNFIREEYFSMQYWLSDI